MKFVKWVVVIVILFLGWKYAVPKIKEKLDSSSSTSSASSAASACVDRAAAASDAWGNGLGRFVNPPIDLTAWGEFRGDVETKIARAQAECGCAEEPCRAAKSALSDLRSLIAEIDSAARSGMPPPTDAVQRQEAIDDAINAARDQAQSGK